MDFADTSIAQVKQFAKKIIQDACAQQKLAKVVKAIANIETPKVYNNLPYDKNFGFSNRPKIAKYHEKSCSCSSSSKYKYFSKIKDVISI